ncbi:hypothetical protein VNO77_16903 [Canavalia gladiata]|uniref:BZIP domain-containing protein n=1 Tax=Canavalia gladiata TaxID=3824 RepID=A0AAN9QG32_CANGL
MFPQRMFKPPLSTTKNSSLYTAEVPAESVLGFCSWIHTGFASIKSQNSREIRCVLFPWIQIWCQVYSFGCKNHCFQAGSGVQMIMGSQGGAIQEPKTGSLAREGSLYNLTLDEVHNQLGNLGKPLGSMNLDELLKSVWTSESGNDAYMEQHASGSSLNPQGSLALCGDLSKKTIDEVWRDMQEKKSGSLQDRKTQERQVTLGEMTLEDFLVKAGVATETFTNEDSAVAMSGVDSQHNASQLGNWMQYQLTSVQQQHQNQKNNAMPGFTGFMAGHVVQQPIPVVVNPVLDAGYTEAMPSSLMSALSDTQTPGRKRVASGNVVEKTVERRQKRMIKNRESAARSRARKQAYTQELEIKVSRLEEENERLRRQNVCFNSFVTLEDLQILEHVLHLIGLIDSMMETGVMKKTVKKDHKEVAQQASPVLIVIYTLDILEYPVASRFGQPSSVQLFLLINFQSMLIEFNPNLLEMMYVQRFLSECSKLLEQTAHVEEIERVLPSAPPPDPKHQLRRTSSAPL